MAHSLPETVTAIAPAKRREPLLLLSHLCRDKTSPNPRHTNKSHLTGSGVLESGIDPTAIAPRQPGADASGGALRAGFTAMTEGTQADWNRIVEAQLEFYPGLTDRVMSHLGLLSGDYGGFTVDRLTHSLQTATRAVRANRSDSYVACALLHDIGDTLGSFNHPDIGAAIVWPFVDDDLHWMVQQHGIF